MIGQGKHKEQFGRTYYGYNPNAYEGPTTAVLDTIVLPIARAENEPSIVNAEVFASIYSDQSGALFRARH